MKISHKLVVILRQSTSKCGTYEVHCCKYEVMCATFVLACGKVEIFFHGKCYKISTYYLHSYKFSID